MSAILLLQLDANPIAVTERRGDKSASATRKRVEYDGAWPREGLDERHQYAHGFLGGMCSVPGVLPGLNVLDRVIWYRREALGQEIRLLMMST